MVMTMANLALRHVKKTYGNNVAAVDDFSLEVGDKEFIVLVGPSGCGKSTTLRMIAGLEEISAGEIFIEDRLVNDVLPKDRDIAMVFQNYALYPHMSVFDNIAYSLKLRKFSKEQISAKVNEAADMLGIADLLDRKPKALSGGQMQRVAIGRAIVREPKVFLMDEPLSNLDAKLRAQMRTEIIKLKDRINTTFVYVTHDQVEAMTLGDRIVVMKDGFIQQIGTPTEVFFNPYNIFVATFIGTPRMNTLDAELALKDGAYSVDIGDVAIDLPEKTQQALAGKGMKPGGVVMGIRPEHVGVVEDGAPDSIKVEIDVSEMMGSELYIHARYNGSGLVIRCPVSGSQDGALPGQPQNGLVSCVLPGACVFLFDRESGVNLLAGRAGYREATCRTA
jgi:multiple sugar transport system ATP-binding protein